MKQEPAPKAAAKTAPKQGLNASIGGKNVPEKKEVQSKIQTSPTKKDPLNTTASKLQTKPSQPTLKLKPVEDDTFQVNPGSKEKRAQQDAKIRWMHEELKPDQVDRVKLLCEQIFGYEYCKEMFS